MVLSRPGPVGGSSWAWAHGTHNAPLFPAGEGNYPRWEKENIFDWHGEQWTINVGMFQREFSNFLDSHLLWSLGIPLRLEVSIKGLEVADSFVPLVIPGLSTEKVGWALSGVRLGGLLNQ